MPRFAYFCRCLDLTNINQNSESPRAECVPHTPSSRTPSFQPLENGEVMGRAPRGGGGQSVGSGFGAAASKAGGGADTNQGAKATSAQVSKQTSVDGAPASAREDDSFQSVSA